MDDMINGLKVLVTGGAGFIGSNLILRLKEGGAQIRANLLKQPLQIASDGIEIVYNDLRDLSACHEIVENIDIVRGGRDINLAACVELIHGATLLHDDVIDNSDMRRGKKTINIIWGNQSSILTGDYLLSRCFEMMVEDGNLEILKLLSSTSAKIAQGEILQLQHKGEIDMLEETYLKIIYSKTAALFSAATKVGAILSKKNNKEKEALEFYGKNLGLTFQIADDTLDYNSEINLFGKKVGNDFYEGKITLPIILLYQQTNYTEKKKLENIFKQDVRSADDLSIILKLISKYKIISKCYKKAEHFINLATNSLSIFKDSEEKKKLENLTFFSLERSF